jgi:cholesterol transport system auxiliary component
MHDRRKEAASRRRGIVGAGFALGLAALLGGCASGAAPTTYDLTAPREALSARRSGALLVVAEPQTLQAFDSDRVIVRTREGGIAALPEMQWADRLPRLIQTRLIQTFENASRITAIGRPGDRLVPAAQLNSEIRTFALDERTGEAVVEISVKIVNDRSGRILAGQVFTSRVPAGAGSGAAVPAALDLAMQALLRDVVRWTSARI